jgi:hypothetical protein
LVILRKNYLPGLSANGVYEIIIPIKQDAEAKKFLQYFIENYIEKQDENILQKIVSLFIKK